MKKTIISILISITPLVGCSKLDLNPLSEGSSANWYSNETEINMSLNDLYRGYAWNMTWDGDTDNWTSRQTTTPITAGTINGEWSTITNWWLNTYKAIARANTLLESIDRAEGKISAAKLDQFKADASFVRACMYSNLITRFGDVPFLTKTISVDEAFKVPRTDMDVIKQKIYDDFDLAIEYLPVSYSSSEYSHATRGAALAMKARTALYMGDWGIARDAAKACMDMGVYSLHPVYGDLFLSKTRNSIETIFAIPRSVELNEMLGSNYPVRATLPRNNGGWNSYNPSFELFYSYTCTDGLTVDISPLFDPKQPFKNRDPRCNMTIVEFNTEFLGFIYNPNPYATQTMNTRTDKMQTNNDSRINTQYASMNALVWRKGVDEDWEDLKTDPDNIIIRYADVLLMYAEAKIELGEIDQTVRDAINTVRARAYNGTGIPYPQVTSAVKEELRLIVRNERRVELANENLRYMDLIRWRLAEKALIRPIYGILDPAEQKTKLVDAGLYFLPSPPVIDADGLPDLTTLYNNGYLKLLAVRGFDATKQYLWPIPTKEILINKNLVQNPGY